MESKTGSLLTRISAIINFVVGGLVLFFGLISVIGLSIYQGMPFNFVIVILFFSLVALGIGYLLWNASEKMKSPKTVKNGAIWAIVLGALTISAITGILALVGGIIAIIDSDKKTK